MGRPCSSYMDFKARLLNWTFVVRLGKVIEPRLRDMVSESLTWEMTHALALLSGLPEDQT